MKRRTRRIGRLGAGGWKSTRKEMRKTFWRRRMRRWMHFGGHWMRCTARGRKQGCEEAAESGKKKKELTQRAQSTPRPGVNAEQREELRERPPRGSGAF